MTIQQALESLFENGVQQVTIGRPEQKPGVFFASTTLGITTGDMGNQIICNFQAVDDKFSNCVDSLATQVGKLKHMEVKPTIVTLPNGGKRN